MRLPNDGTHFDWRCSICWKLWGHRRPVFWPTDETVCGDSEAIRPTQVPSTSRAVPWNDLRSGAFTASGGEKKQGHRSTKTHTSGTRSFGCDHCVQSSAAIILQSRTPASALFSLSSLFLRACRPAARTTVHAFTTLKRRSPVRWIWRPFWLKSY